MDETQATRLLDGPRGRRLCLELAEILSEEVALLVWELAARLDPHRGTWQMAPLVEAEPDPATAPQEPREVQEVQGASIPALISALGRASLGGLSPTSAQEAFGAAVDAAWYWQEPAGEDRLAADRDVQAALRPLAHELTVHPELSWWSQDALEQQSLIAWEDPDASHGGQGPSLQEWARSTRAEELRAQRDRPADPQANSSGTWWSTPVISRRSTVGRIPETLDLVEDGFGWEAADVAPVARPERVLELRSAEDWVRLCRTHPLEVSASRRHDWYRATGVDGRWVIPDWSAVAQEADAVHLPAVTYLELAGRALPLGDGRSTMIAGWDPDATFWLRGDPVSTGPSERWLRGSQDDRWRRG